MWKWTLINGHFKKFIFTGKKVIDANRWGWPAVETILKILTLLEEGNKTSGFKVAKEKLKNKWKQWQDQFGAIYFITWNSFHDFGKYSFKFLAQKIDPPNGSPKLH